MVNSDKGGKSASLGRTWSHVPHTRVLIGHLNDDVEQAVRTAVVVKNSRGVRIDLKFRNLNTKMYTLQPYYIAIFGTILKVKLCYKEFYNINNKIIQKILFGSQDMALLHRNPLYSEVCYYEVKL